MPVNRAPEGSFGNATGLGRLPANRDPLLDLFGFMSSVPGVTSCCDFGLGGRERDFCVDAGLFDRLVCGLADFGLGIKSETFRGIRLDRVGDIVPLSESPSSPPSSSSSE